MALIIFIHIEMIAEEEAFLFFARKIYYQKKISSLSKNTEIIETCVIKLILNGQNTYIIGIYRPPSSNINDFLIELEQILWSIPVNNNELVILTGDFNIDLTTLNANTTNDLMSLLSSMFMYPIITKPTRLENNSSTLDQIWINRYLPTFAGIIYFDVTDHCPCFLNFKLPKSQLIKDKITIESRPFTETKLNLLIEKMINTDWNDLINFDDVNSCFNNFINQ